MSLFLALSNAKKSTATIAATAALIQQFPNFVNTVKSNSLHPYCYHESVSDFYEYFKYVYKPKHKHDIFLKKKLRLEKKDSKAKQ